MEDAKIARPLPLRATLRIWFSHPMRNVAHEGDDTDLVSTAEAAALLGKSIATINRWADSGDLPVAAKAPGIRGARLFTRASVEAMASVGAA